MRVLGLPADGTEAALRDAGAELLRSLAEPPRHLQLGQPDEPATNPASLGNIRRPTGNRD